VKRYERVVMRVGLVVTATWAVASCGLVCLGVVTLPGALQGAYFGLQLGVLGFLAWVMA
jgi:hypothetical protein